MIEKITVQVAGNMGKHGETWGQTGSFFMLLFAIKNYRKRSVCLQVFKNGGWSREWTGGPDS
jgi:hypothetical protein